MKNLLLFAGLVLSHLLAHPVFALSSAAPKFYPTNVESPTLDPGLSGSWYDPDKDGQGFTLQVIDDGQVLATWFTYDIEGNQAWIQGIGALTNKRLEFESLRRFKGPRFGEDFDPEDRQTLPAGSMVMSFTSCSSGEVIYSGSLGFPSDTLALERLTGLSGFGCKSTDQQDLDAYPPSAVLSGAWYSPLTDGQGWMIEVLDASTVLVYWFTYDEEGDQRWMLGVGELDNGIISVDGMELITGPSFGPEYQASDLVRESWGDLRLHIWPCDLTSAWSMAQGKSLTFQDIQPLVPINRTTSCVTPKQPQKPSPQSAFDPSAKQIWIGADLEGSTPYCNHRTIRWASIKTDFDINLDGKPDMLLPISCYQGMEPHPQEKSNQEVIAAWKMWCSQPDGSHQDCTEQLFGTQAIKATGELKTGGGNPYIHVMDTPRDLNGDGYPDFWYALNRDDGRPGFDSQDPADQILLREFCGARQDNPAFEWDCTRKSTQTVLLSQGDGTYKVLEMPFGQRNTQAAAMLPNAHGTFDFFAFNYGHYSIARLTKDNAFIDVTEEYENYKNIETAGFINPYVSTFEHEGHFYLVVSEVQSSIYDHPGADTFDRLPQNEPPRNGMVLWRFEPGVGFHLSDYYLPAPETQFTYLEKQGEQIIERDGAWIRGVPVYEPRWNFFEFTQLHPLEEPVLAVVQEADTTAGEFFRAPPDSGLVYEKGNWAAGDKRNSLYQILAIEGFYIRDGKFVPRDRSIVPGDAIFNSPGFKFLDLNKDGYLDMYGITGHYQRPLIYLNNKQGLLEKLALYDYIPPLEFIDRRFSWTLDFAIRDLGRAPILDLVYWGTGRVFWLDNFSQLIDGHTPPELGIIRGAINIDQIPRETPEEEQALFTKCIGQPPECNIFFPGWMYSDN